MIDEGYKVLFDQGVLGVCLVVAIAGNVALFAWIKKLVKENREDRQQYSAALEKMAASFLQKIQEATEAQKEAAANQSKIVTALERIESDQNRILDRLSAKN